MDQRWDYKRHAHWCNAIADAYAMGEAPWAYPDGCSLAAKVWCDEFERTGSHNAATDAVECLAREHGIEPRRHRWHGKDKCR